MLVNVRLLEQAQSWKLISNFGLVWVKMATLLSTVQFCVYGGDGVKLNYCFSIFLLLMLNYGYILVFVTDYNTTIGCGNTVKMYLVAFHYIAHSR